MAIIIATAVTVTAVMVITALWLVRYIDAHEAAENQEADQKHDEHWNIGRDA